MTKNERAALETRRWFAAVKENWAAVEQHFGNPPARPEHDTGRCGLCK